MLKGLMQDRPLLVSSLIEHAARCHPRAEIVSRTAEGTMSRCTYGDLSRRSRQVAAALLALGVGPGDRIGTLAWNGYRHLEMYYGVSGIGAVLHTIHPRQFPEQLEYVINHAEDRYLFFDITFAPLVERLAPALKGVKRFVAMTDRKNLPLSDIPNLLCYEDLIAEANPDFEWPTFDETTASSLCYTAGTTGTPKGVLYSHRSTVLHAMTLCATDSLALSANESALLASPMYHVNAWGVPYAAAMCGMKLVLPGPVHDGRSIYELLREERVTLALGVPQFWSPLFQYLEGMRRNPRKELCLERVVVGGTASSREFVDKLASTFGARVTQVWGMTETSPIGATCPPTAMHADASNVPSEQRGLKQGRPPFGIEMRLVDDAGREIAHDGCTPGRLLARGPWVASGYFKSPEGSRLDADGFFDTGDIATIDADGYLQITDRAADAIKSGDDWMSSIELENAAVGHPAVAEAAVIALDEDGRRTHRLLVILPRTDFDVSRDELLEYLAVKLDRRWLPDDVAFVEQFPHTATGKVRKGRLREMFADHRWPTDLQSQPA
ncbi:MAG TPA: long-chain-fatty-acid--CoA ligase [Aromatoleum sp.]|uniref:long-chain-fatty-acid--CoA ligase n=1 Tax=Aromatoleum sp. TaxID=2307007 RepID=UPI002B498724|nr:long-chain-fatty-acid--CoA ligase [Aromatoleum sp.]HJV26993.1 long-chain-fatty-acid--CoA ligase [Aromatoleum sp.]